MSDWLAMAIFIPKGERAPSEDEVLDRIGVDRAEHRWGPLAHVEWHVEELDFHLLAQLRFLQGALLKLLPEHGGDLPLAEDGALPLAHAFRDASARAGAEVGMLITHPEQAEREWILERYWMVLARDAASLASEHFGLLYMNDEVASNYTPETRRDARDELPGGPGRTIFAGRGSARWF